MAAESVRIVVLPRANSNTPEWLEEHLEQLRSARRAAAFQENRDSILCRLGYPSYENYLRRALWKRIRERVRERDKHMCRRCDEKEERIPHEVHHDSYTEAAMMGEDDSALFLLCAKCHEKVEFSETGLPRTVDENHRVLRDRDGALAERRAEEQALNFKEKVMALYGRRCHWCKGDTELLGWNSDGDIYVIKFESSNQMAIWACSSCRSTLDSNKTGQLRSDSEKLKLLGKNPSKLYQRRVPSTSFSFTNGFKKLNAMQKEGLLNEFHWHAARLKAKYENRRIEPAKLAELRSRFEETKMNGR